MSDDLVNTLQQLADVLQTQRTLGGDAGQHRRGGDRVGAGLRRGDHRHLDRRAARHRGDDRHRRPRARPGAVRQRRRAVPDVVPHRQRAAPRPDRAGRDLPARRDRRPTSRRPCRAVGPAIWGTETIATLNLYSRTGPFDESAETVAAVLAAQVAIAVSRSPEFAAARAVVEEAQRNTDDHSQISFATGLLIGSQDCTREQAEGLLRQAADQDEQTILQIAQRIIEQHDTTR